MPQDETESSVERGHADQSFAVRIAPNPVEELRRFLSDKKYFVGIIMSTAFFEHYGMKKIKNHFDTSGIHIGENRIERLPLGEIIVVLYGLGLVTEQTYSKMFEVKQKRDNLVHDISAKYELTQNDGRRTLEKAIQCMDDLMCHIE